jgi:hypothetical protein
MEIQNFQDQNNDIFCTVQVFLKIAIDLVIYAGLNSFFRFIFIFFINVSSFY